MPVLCPLAALYCILATSSLEPVEKNEDHMVRFRSVGLVAQVYLIPSEFDECIERPQVDLACR